MKYVFYDWLSLMKIVHIRPLAQHKHTNVYIYCRNGDGLLQLLGLDWVLECVINPIEL